MRLVKGINKIPFLNEQNKLIISKVFLGGTAPSSSFYKLVQVTNQPLMALGIHGLHELAEQNGTELKKVYGSERGKTNN